MGCLKTKQKPWNSPNPRFRWHISPKIPRLFPESHGSQPRAAATNLRLRTRGLAGVSGAGVRKIPALGYHPAGETPELRNSAEIPKISKDGEVLWQIQLKVGIQEPWCILSQILENLFPNFAHSTQNLAKVDQQESETLHSPNFWRFLSLPPDYQRWQLDFPFWVRRYQQESSSALLISGWFGGYTTQYLGILISASSHIFGVSTGESPSCWLACNGFQVSTMVWLGWSGATPTTKSRGWCHCPMTWEYWTSPYSSHKKDHMGVSENSVPHCTQWFCWSLSLLNGYFIGKINPTFSDKAIYRSWLGDVKHGDMTNDPCP